MYVYVPQVWPVSSQSGECRICQSWKNRWVLATVYVYAYDAYDVYEYDAYDVYDVCSMYMCMCMFMSSATWTQVLNKSS